MLIHMAPGEVHSLQKLAEHHGGSLSINPDTGLPEAGFLSSLLPTLIGAGLTVASGGALTPLMAAGMTGAGYGLATGSLSKGLMAGLGAYGGAGLTGGLMGAGEGLIGSEAVAGSSAVPQSILEGATPEAAKAAVSNEAISGASNLDKLGAGFKNVTGSGGLDALKAGMPAGGFGFNKMAFMAGAPLIADAMNPQQPTAVPYQSDSQMPQRLRYAGNNQYQQISNEEAKRLRGYADGGVLTSSDNANQMFGSEALYAQYLPSTTQGVAALPTSTSMQAPMTPMAPAMQPRADVPEYGNLGQDFGKEQMYGAYVPPTNTAAASSVAAADIAGRPSDSAFNFISGDGPSNSSTADTSFDAADIGLGISGTSVAADSDGPVGDGFAKGGSTGGLGSLGGYSDGGRLLRGPGDGVSDSIPAVIGKKQPARLADGEFVVPARIVSELGNGSTEAGARKLYAMLDRIQKGRAKTIGKNKVATNSKMSKYLPA
jgi:hypothetical protein